MADKPSQAAMKAAVAGNIDLAQRPIAYNPDGSYSTVRTMTFEDGPGRYVNVPSVMDDGRVVGQKEALAAYRKSGKHLGKFENLKSAVNSAQNLHEEQAADYDKMAAEGQPTTGPAYVAPAQLDGMQAAVKNYQPLLRNPTMPFQGSEAYDRGYPGGGAQSDPWGNALIDMASGPISGALRGGAGFAAETAPRLANAAGAFRDANGASEYYAGAAKLLKTLKNDSPVGPAHKVGMFYVEPGQAAESARIAERLAGEARVPTAKRLQEAVHGFENPYYHPAAGEELKDLQSMRIEPKLVEQPARAATPSTPRDALTNPGVRGQVRVTPTQPPASAPSAPPTLPGNPARHPQFMRQVGALAAYGRAEGWKPKDIAAAIDKIREHHDFGAPGATDE